MAQARFVVTGRVQGVGFRAATRAQALHLQLFGIARNLADGSVEVWVEGDPEAIDALEQWLYHGPPLARVDRVARSPDAAGRLPTGHGFMIA